MTPEEQVRQAVRHVGDRTAVPEVDLDAVRARARRNRRAQVSVAAAVAVAAIIVVMIPLLVSRDGIDPGPADDGKPPGLVVGAVPVWYDAAGLHRGAVVEQTAVGLGPDADGGGVLTLVRRGALYRDPTNDDVWFHPWGGEPRVVGHGSTSGPGSDPDGDVAAWFDGDELVVYDTTLDREISRTRPADDGTAVQQGGSVVDHAGTEHVRGGNGFKHVSGAEVVWRAAGVEGLEHMYRLDVATGRSTALQGPPVGESPMLEDVHGETRIWGVWGGGTRGALRIDVTGREELSLGALEPLGRLSADGSFVLAPVRPGISHGAAIAHARSGEVWRLPYRDVYAWIAWSYGDVAMVLVDRDPGGDAEKSLVACDAGSQRCERLPTRGDVLLPTS